MKYHKQQKPQYLWRAFVARGECIAPRKVTADDLPHWLAEVIEAHPELRRVDLEKMKPYRSYHIIERV